MNSVAALFVANAKEFFRDRVAMFLTLLMPILLALFFGMIFGNTQGYKLHLGVATEDAGPAGEQFAAQISEPAVNGIVILERGAREDLLAALGKGKLDVVLVLPEAFSSTLAVGQRTVVEMYYDATRQSSAGTGRGIVESMLANANLALGGAPQLLVAEEHTVQARPLRAVDFFVPSLLGMAMLWLGLFATAQPLVELRVQQVLRRFGATPLSRGKLIASQVSWRVALGVLQAVLFLLVGNYLMDVHVTGNWLLFAAATLLGALAFVSIGFFIAAVAKTVESAVAIAQIVNFPMMFLTNTFFEPGMLPSYLQPVQQLLPLTYLNDALRQTMVDYTSMNALWLDFAVLGGWLVVMLGLSLRLFRWE